MVVKAKKKVVRKKKPVIDDLDMLARVSQYENDLDRHNDFKTVFETEQGKKVLREILGMGYILNDNIKINKYGVDTSATLISTGERKLALAIHRITTVEPLTSPPRKQITRR